ncbi:MAG: phospholipid carrier-dependent glycosyltransferase [candidate division FCPU426 bacterium]
MIPGNAQRSIRILQAALMAVAACYIGLYIWVALQRLGYPFELEWIEGAMVDTVQRILDGKPLFVQPSLDYGYFMYTPLYFWISAAVAKWIGIGFLPLRLVSFASSLGCLALIYALVFHENRSHWAGMVAAGLFAATFKISGAWFDIARLDSLFLLFTLAALYSLRRSRLAWTWQLLTGVMLFLALLAKQAALIIFAPVLLAGLWFEPRKTAPAVLIAAVMSAAAYGWGNWVSHGWVHYYLFELPRHHPLLPNIFLDYWTLDLLKPMPIALGLSLWAAVLFLRNQQPGNYFYGLAGLGMVGASYLFRLHFGGYNNVLFPVYAWLAMGFGLALPEILRRLQSPASEPRPWTVGTAVLVLGLCLLQFGMLFYDPSKQIPTPADRQAGLAFIEKMKSFPGDVYVPFTGYLPTLAGKKTFLHQGTLADILIKGRADRTSKQLSEEIRQAIREQKFAALITINGDLADNRSRFLELFGEDMRGYYRLEEQLAWGDCFMPVTGAPRRPENVWVPVKTQQ